MTIPLFAHIAAGSYLLPAAAALKYRNQLNRPMKFFALFSFYSMLHIAAEFILGRFGIRNQFLLNIFRLALLESILYLYIQWTGQKWIKDTLNGAGVLYLIFWMIDVTFTPFPNEFREHIAATANAILLIASIIILTDMVRNSTNRVAEHAVYWIATGITLYSAGTVVVLLLSNSILAMGIDYFIALWYINWGFTIIANIFFVKAFLCKIF